MVLSGTNVQKLSSCWHFPDVVIFFKLAQLICCSLQFVQYLSEGFSVTLARNAEVYGQLSSIDLQWTYI